MRIASRWEECICQLSLSLVLLSWMMLAGSARSFGLRPTAAKATARQVWQDSHRNFEIESKQHSLRLGQAAVVRQAMGSQPALALTSREGTAGQTFARLMAQAQAVGSVRVIVGLRASFQPEGTLVTSDAVQAQQSAIALAQTALLNQMAAYPITGVKQFPYIPFLALEVDAAGLQYLASAPEVATVQEDQLIELALAQSVPLIGAPVAWANGWTGAGQTVAIIDTGVDKTHPFLAGKVVSEACYSTTSASAGTTSLCPGGVAQSTSTGAGVNCAITGCEHGTHVAGIAAGKGNNFSGVAKDANLIAIQVLSKFTTCPPFPNSCLTAFRSDMILGLQRVQALSSSFNIAAVNVSLSGGIFNSNCDASDLAFKAAVDNLRSLGIATVVASGNDSMRDSLGSPSCISTTISVGSTSNANSGITPDVVSNFSNNASFLNLLAPGASITSSVPGSGFASLQGTSLAAPHVTGAWAVLKSKSPTATVSQILSALTSTGLPVTDQRNGIVKPRLRVDAAANALSSIGCNLALSANKQSFSAGAGTGSVSVSAEAGCAWTASSNNSWINVTTGNSSSGSGTVNYTVAANTSVARTGTLFIAGQTFIVTQAANPQIITLAVDDGSMERSIGAVNGGTAFVVNRLTPTSYPATLNAVAIFLPAGAGLIQGQSLTVLAGANPSGSSNINSVSLQATSTTIQALDQFNVFTVPSLTITSGDFVVGMRITYAAGATPFAIDESLPRQRRSYISAGGSAFALIDDMNFPGNFMIRAMVTPEPSSCLTLTNINPSSGVIGSNVIITGANFAGVNSVKFSNNIAANFTIVNATTITATVPSGALTGSITISKPGCSDTPSASFTVTSAPQIGFLYVLNQRTVGSNLLFGYAVNETTGALTKLSGFPINTGGSGANTALSEQVTIDRTNRRLYVLNDGASTISAYSINPTTGALTPLPFSPLDLGSGTWVNLAVHPSGSPLVVSDAAIPGRLLSYRITATTATQTGIPASLNGAPFSTAFSQDGNYVYASGSGGNAFAGFSVNAATGVLTALTGSPFNSGNSNPVAYATDPMGRLLMANMTTGEVRVFTTANGIPSLTPGNPFPSGLTQATHGLVHPNGFYLVADRGSNGTLGNRVGVYRIQGSGSATTLAAVAGSPFAVSGSLTDVLALNQSGTFLFAANGESRNLTTFRINPTTGALTLQGTQPTDTLEASGRLTGMAYLAGASAPCPAITGLNLPGGPVGSSVTITGMGLTGISSAKFSNNAAATFTIINDTTLTVIVPNSAVSGPITLSKTGCSDVQTNSFTVACPAITVSPASLPDGALNIAYNQTVTASGGAAITSFTLSAGTLPPGLTLSSSGLLYGTPTQSGRFNFTIKATDVTGCAGTQSYSMVINCLAITLTPTTLLNGTIGAAYAQTIAASPTGNYTFGVSTGTLPAGLSLNSATGTITGTPTTVGASNFTITALNSGQCSGSQSYTISIQALCPTITNLSPTSGLIGSSVTITGTNFTEVSGVKFSNGVLAAFNVVNDTTITTSVPSGAVSGPITLSKPNCGETPTPAFIIILPPPCVTVASSNTLIGSSGSSLIIPISVGDLTGRNVVAYDFAVAFDPSVIRPSSTATDQNGTLSNGFNVIANTTTPGKLSVSGFGPTPLIGAGRLINLKFDLIGADGACSDLTWSSFSFNDGLPCVTLSNGRICLLGGSISGTVNYGTALTPRAVPGVKLTADGVSYATSLTDSAGNYSLAGLGGGPYTVTPTKTGEVNGISSFDASLVAQFAAGLIALSPNQQIAADASGNGVVTAFDAALIAQTAAGIPNTGLAGTWKFISTNRSYPTLIGNQTNQNFDALLIGDVSGNWVPSTVSSAITVTLPQASGAIGSAVTIPITVGDLTGRGVTAYDFTVAFDPKVLQLQSPAIDADGTLSSGMNLTINTSTPGLLTVSAFLATPLSGAGTLLNLKFTVVGEQGNSTSLMWSAPRLFTFNEGSPPADLTHGNLTVTGLDQAMQRQGNLSQNPSLMNSMVFTSSTHEAACMTLRKRRRWFEPSVD